MAIDKLEVISKARNGLSAAEIAKLLGVTASYVEQILADAREKNLIGPPRMDRAARAKRRREIADFVASGKTAKQAAEKFGVSIPFVQYACQEFGVSTGGKNERVSLFAIIADMLDHPDDDGSRIAKRLGVTRQYVNATKQQAIRDGLLAAIERAKKRAAKESREDRGGE